MGRILSLRDKEIKRYADYLTVDIEVIETAFKEVGQEYVIEKINVLSQYERNRTMDRKHRLRFFLKALEEDWKPYPEKIEVPDSPEVIDFKAFKDRKNNKPSLSTIANL